MKKYIFVLSLVVVGAIYELPSLGVGVADAQQKAIAKTDDQRLTQDPYFSRGDNPKSKIQNLKLNDQKVAQISNSTALAAGFVELLAREEFFGAAQNFDSAMKAQLTPFKLKTVWQSLTTQLGPFKKQVGFRTERSQQNEVVIVTCEFDKAALDIRVVYNNTKQITGLSFVPKQTAVEYQQPGYVKLAAFQEKAVQIGTGAKTLPGTLSLPVGNGPFPVIVLVHGSGPNDRDESLGANKPFRDLAGGLASQGIAVLRYDKRTKVYPQDFLQGNFTVKEEVIDDCLAAVSLLRKTPEINPQKIFVLGHSLGGMLIPRIGKLDPKIAGFIVMAGNTRPVEDLVVEQMSYLASLDEDVSPEKKKLLAEIQQQVDKIKSPQLFNAPATELLLGAPPRYWLDLRGYNPPLVATQLIQPMLILQGKRDYQVTMQDFRGWQKALSKRRNVTFKTYPNLNHLFLAGEGKSTPKEYQNTGHIYYEVIQDIAGWIERQ